MKKLFIAAMALASVVACSKDEVVDQQQSVAIGFEQAFVENITRANDPSITKATLGAFDVWGFFTNEEDQKGAVFTQQRVTENGQDWTYSPLQYWLPGNSYHFGALAPVGSSNWSVEPEMDDAGLGVVSFENVDGTEDLLYAEAFVETVDYNKVGLTFNHLLSKVKFSFTNGFASPNYTISVKNIKMIVPAEASIDLTADWKWVGHNGTTTLEFGDMESEKIQVTKGAESKNERLTIPALATQEYTVTFDVELYQGDVLAYSNALSTTISGAELKIGNAYNFHATLDHTNIAGDALKPIEFDVTKVNEWVDGNGYEGNVIDTEVVGVSSAAELVAAAKAGATNFRLIDNVNGTLTFSNTMRSAANYTLDLNGKTIDVDGDAIVVDNGVQLTINGNGTVKAGQNASGNALWVKHGDVTINGGSWYVGNDGNERNDCIYVGSAANKDNAGQFVSSVTINAGTFEAAVEEFGQYWVLNIQDKFAVAGSTITVYGGSYKNFDPANNVSEGAKTNFVAQDYESVADGEFFNVVPALEQHFVATAAELFAAVNAGGKITLTENIAISTPVIVNAGQKVVIDLNGKNITAGKWAEAGSKDATESYAFWAKGGELVINGEGTVSTEACKYSMAVWANGGKVVINGGTYKNAGEGSDLIYASNGSVVDINGGTFEACVKQPGTDGTMNNRSALNCKDGDYRAGKAGFVVKGGKFLEFNPANNASEGANTNFCATGKTVEEDGNYYIVK